MRRKLRNRIREVYETQDRCAFVLKINDGILSRIITGTRDITDAQMELFCKHLDITIKEIEEKDDE